MDREIRKLRSCEEFINSFLLSQIYCVSKSADYYITMITGTIVKITTINKQLQSNINFYKLYRSLMDYEY